LGREARAQKPAAGPAKAKQEEQAMVGNCPDFDLAPLVEFPPSVLAQQGYHAADAFVLTPEAEVEHAFEDPTFATALSRLDEVHPQNWNDLRSLAANSPGDSSIRKYITLVRNNFGAHYYQPKALLKGYQGFFFEAPNEFNAAALASFGRKVEATRFYFADAAAQMGQKLASNSDDRVAEIRACVLTMFNALRFVIESYLTVKKENLAGGKQQA
jgi:hypothetical protein